MSNMHVSKRYWAEVTFKDAAGALRTKRVLTTHYTKPVHRDTWGSRREADQAARSRAYEGQTDLGWTDVHVTVRECATDAIVYEYRA